MSIAAYRQELRSAGNFEVADRLRAICGSAGGKAGAARHGRHGVARHGRAGHGRHGLNNTEWSYLSLTWPSWQTS